MNPTPRQQGLNLIASLDQALGQVENEVESQLYWQTLTSRQTPKATVLAIMREVMLEIWSYQKVVDHAVFTAVGRLGTDINEQGLIRSMIAVQIEETGHGTLALQDYLALGGDREFATQRRPSPQSQALIGVVRVLGEREHPLCHLGFMYFFERFTTMMTTKVLPTLVAAGYPHDRLAFMSLHAAEDLRHADMLANVIEECVEHYHGAAEAIIHGFETFRVVYPHPIWRTAFHRATEPLAE